MSTRALAAADPAPRWYQPELCQTPVDEPTLRELGQLLVEHVRAEQPLSSALLPAHAVAVTTASRAGSLHPDEAFAIVAAHVDALMSTSRYTSKSANKLIRAQADFVRYLSRRGVTDVSAVEPELVADFLEAPSGTTMAPPDEPAKRLRYWAANQLYQVLIELGAVRWNPAPLASRNHDNQSSPKRQPNVSTRPLSDAEEALARRYTHANAHDDRGPTAWAFGQATATSTETDRICLADVEARQGFVYLPGCTSRIARWGELTPWGAEQVQRRVERIRASSLHVEPDICVLAPLPGDRRTSTNALIRSALRDAGLLTADPAIRVASLPAWAGRRIYDSSNDPLETAHRMGYRSTDDALAAIKAPVGRSDLPPEWRRRV